MFLITGVKRPEPCRRARSLQYGGMDKIQVITPTGRLLRVRLSTILKVESTYDTWTGRRYFLRYKSGRRLEVDHDSATEVFDALSPKLFEEN